jgi:AraC-like DNA-binding protein
MVRDDAVHFWHWGSQPPWDFAGACLGAGRPIPHVHEEWQFAVPEGPSKLSVGAFRRYTTRECDVAVVAPYDVHAEGSEAESDGRWRALFVASSLLARLYQEVTGQPSRGPLRFSGPVLTDPAAALELRSLLVGEGDMTAGSGCHSALCRWLGQLLRRHAAVTAETRHSPAVQRARVYLEERPTQAVSLPEIGAVAGVTTSHLVRSFSRAVGLPPRSFHTQVRLARAERLLAEGRPVTWVAYECGFSDQSHLSRRFKESHGLSPRAYQAQVRGTATAA